MSEVAPKLGAASEGRQRGRRVLILVLALTVTFMIAEVIGGLITGSLALLADAGHMLTDAGALALSLFALWFATRPATAKKSFGFHRTEILAALVNGVAIVVIAIMIFFEAIKRIGQPPEVETGLMLVVAILGLIVNIIAAWLLHRECTHSHSLNMRGAFLHVMGDLLGSVGAIVAAIVMMIWGLWIVDPLVSFFVAGLIVLSAFKLIREAVDVLLEGTPAHLDLEEIRTALEDIDGVEAVHDLHVWTITSGFDSLTAHLVLKNGAAHQQVLEASHKMLVDRFGLYHSTLQPEECGLDPCGDPARPNGTGSSNEDLSDI